MWSSYGDKLASLYFLFFSFPAFSLLLIRITDIIIPDIRPNLDLAPSNIRLSDMELTLVNLRFREYKLKRALEPVLKLYDYIILDCPPSLGLLTVNALIAATQVLIPMASEYYSMLGVSLLIKTIQTIKSEANPDLNILGIIPTHHKPTLLLLQDSCVVANVMLPLLVKKNLKLIKVMARFITGFTTAARRS